MANCSFKEVIAMFRRSLVVVALWALQACSSRADDPSADGSTAAEAGRPFPEASARDLQQTLDGVVAASVSPGVAVLVKRPGYATWSSAAGVADLENGAQLTPGARFRAGSILK